MNKYKKFMMAFSGEGRKKRSKQAAFIAGHA